MQPARILCLIVVIAVSGSARADRTAPELASAAADALHQLRYADAVSLADEAWRRGESQPDELRALFALAGRAAASLGDAAAARAWFKRWLSIEPTATLPPGTSPKIVALLDQARAGLADTAIAARATRRDRAIAIEVAEDPMTLVHAARLGAERVALTDGAATLPAAPAGGELELLDRHGNIVAIVAIVAITEAPRATPRIDAAPVRAGRPWYAKWPAWGIATGALAAAHFGARWVMSDTAAKIEKYNTESSQHQYTEVQSLVRRGELAQKVGYITAGGVLVTAVVGTVFYFRARGESRFSVAPSGSGVQATWRMEF